MDECLRCLIFILFFVIFFLCILLRFPFFVPVFGRAPKMIFLFNIALTVVLLAAPSYASPQDNWVFPANPDQTSSLISRNKYILKWNSNLKDWFGEYCEACDTKNVDLWVLGGNNFHTLSCNDHLLLLSHAVS